MHKFAIKYNNKNTKEKDILLNFLTEAAKKLPGLTVEGITGNHRGPVLVKEKLLEIFTEEFKIEIGETHEIKRDVIAVGVSNKFDISFEPLSYLKPHPLLTLCPIYDLEKDLDLVLAGFANFLLEKYGVCMDIVIKKVSKPNPVLQITKHSSFVCVGNKILSYEEFEILEKLGVLTQ